MLLLRVVYHVLEGLACNPGAFWDEAVLVFYVRRFAVKVIFTNLKGIPFLIFAALLFRVALSLLYEFCKIEIICAATSQPDVFRA